jgi:crossover junction endodeoxyribonuclease RuvC
MIILGVDPGTIITGFGIIELEKNKITHLASGIIKLPSGQTLPEKLKTIYTELEKLIRKYKPDEFAIETAFYGKNIQSAMKIGYARGVSLLAAINNNVLPTEYAPNEVKKAVVGKGAASKQQVAFMIKTLLNLKQIKMKSDESDALAIAICHSFRMKAPTFKKSKSWKEYIVANPDRVIQYLKN